MIYKSNKDFKRDSLEILKNNWLPAVFVCFLLWFLGSSADTLTTKSIEEVYKNGQIIRRTVETQSGFLGFINLIFAGPISFGAVAYFLKLKRNKEAEVKEIFSG